MSSQKEFILFEHLRMKHPDEERVTIPLTLYDQALPVIKWASQNALRSPKNDTGIFGLVLFGSWARRNIITGPTFFFRY